MNKVLDNNAQSNQLYILNTGLIKPKHKVV